MRADATLALYALKLAEQLQLLEVAVQPLLCDSGLTAAELVRRDSRLPMGKYLKLVQMAQESCGCEDLGLLVGEHTSVLEQGVIGYALLSSSDLRDCLSRYIRYQHLLGPVLQAELHSAADCAWLSARPVAGYPQLSPEQYQFFIQEWLASLNQWGTLVRSGGSLFQCVELDFAAPTAASEQIYRERLGCEVRFACRETRAIFAAELLQQPLEYAQDIIGELCTEQCERLLQTLRLRPGLIAEIHRLLSAHISGPPSMETVASKLCMSVRTLRRHLQREGTSYQQLVIDYRLALAKRYLAETGLPANEIAGLVGYADTANFYRTFRLTEGITPQQYRARDMTPAS